MRKFSPLLFTSLATLIGFSLFIVYSPNPFNLSPENALQPHAAQDLPHNRTLGNCDLFRGSWVRELRSNLLYSNSSCVTIPDSKNCFRNGRRDVEFLNWKWKPENCELQSFDGKRFLEMMRGKKLGFVGDSVARNHMESLLCLLSQEETPTNLYKDSEDRFRRWYFPRNDFTLIILWTKFLVHGEERMVNRTGTTGVFDLHLDKVDQSWSNSLPELDYVVISNGHWFFRPIYLYENDTIMGCVYCQEPNVTRHGVAFAVRMAFRSALGHVNRCDKCKPGMVTLVRTFAPAHFEGGAWDTGGHCNRTGPLGEVATANLDWEMRNVQVEEVERAVKDGKRFGIVDITRAMLMRPDGHPGANWGNKWMRGYNDCVHWCMPGPIDHWNDFLMEIIEREKGLD